MYKYRVIKYGGKYYPQHRNLLLVWCYFYTDDESNPTGPSYCRKSFDNFYKAENFIIDERHRKRKPRRVVIERYKA